MFMLLSRYWWVLVLRGTLAIVVGILAFTLPRTTLAELILTFGAYALVDGVCGVLTGIAGHRVTPHWWILLLQGLAGIGIGALTLFNPLVTAVALLAYIAAWAVVAGALQILTAIVLRQELVGEWWLALGGIFGTAFGIAILWQPGGGVLAVLWMIATYAVVWGAMLIVGGFDLRRARLHAPAA